MRAVDLTQNFASITCEQSSACNGESGSAIIRSEQLIVSADEHWKHFIELATEIKMIKCCD